MRKKIYLRDDDVSYYTNLSELKTLYEPRLKCGLKVNFAVIPFALAAVNIGDFDKLKYLKVKPKAIWENIELMEWLLGWHSKGNVGIALHGYTHEYFIKSGKWYPEHRFSNIFFDREIEHGLLSLRMFFNVNTYVPPSNGISLLGLMQLVYVFGLNVSAPKSLRFLFFLKNFWRIEHVKKFKFSKNKKLYITSPFYNTGIQGDVEECMTVSYHYWEKRTPELLDAIMNEDYEYEIW